MLTQFILEQNKSLETIGNHVHTCDTPERRTRQPCCCMNPMHSTSIVAAQAPTAHSRYTAAASALPNRLALHDAVLSEQQARPKLNYFSATGIKNRTRVETQAPPAAVSYTNSHAELRHQEAVQLHTQLRHCHSRADLQTACG